MLHFLHQLDKPVCPIGAKATGTVTVVTLHNKVEHQQLLASILPLHFTLLLKFCKNNSLLYIPKRTIAVVGSHLSNTFRSNVIGDQGFDTKYISSKETMDHVLD